MPTDIGVQVADRLLEDAIRLAAEQRPAEGALAIARALEVTLAASASKVLLLSPSAEQTRATPAESEMLRKRYMAMIGGMSLPALRNIVMTLVVRKVQPRTIAEALDFIEQSKRYAAVPPAREHFAAIGDAEVRATMEALQGAAIINLSAAVLHQTHQPTSDEIEQLRNSVADLARALVRIFQIEGAAAGTLVSNS